MKKKLLSFLLGFSLLLTLTTAQSFVTYNAGTVIDTLDELYIEWQWPFEFEAFVPFDGASYVGTNWNTTLEFDNFAGFNDITVNWNFEHLQAPHGEAPNASASFTDTIDTASTLPADNMFSQSGSVIHETDQDDWSFNFVRTPLVEGSSVISLHVTHNTPMPIPNSIMLFVLGLGLFFLRKKVA